MLSYTIATAADSQPCCTQSNFDSAFQSCSGDIQSLKHHAKSKSSTMQVHQLLSVLFKVQLNAQASKRTAPLDGYGLKAEFTRASIELIAA